METRTILEKVKNGEIPIEEAERYFKRKPIEDLGFAKLDTHRNIRTGYGEVVYCAGKEDEFLTAIFSRLAKEAGNVLGTRASEKQYALVKTICPEVQYNPVSRLLRIERTPISRRGNVAVCSAGTADIPVAEEAAQVAEFLVPMLPVSMTWALADCIGFYPIWMKSNVPNA